jgi:hypothetical protein
LQRLWQKFRQLLQLLSLKLPERTSAEPPYTSATGIIAAFRRTWSQSLPEAPQFENVALHSLLLLIEQTMPRPSLLQTSSGLTV